MGKPTTIDAVQGALERYGDRATIVTVDGDGRPHVTTSFAHVDGEHLVVTVGGRSRTELAARPTITVVWDPPPGEEYQLIVDGVVTGMDDPDDHGRSTVRVATDRGIEHRVAWATGDGDSCVLVGAA